MNSFRLQAHYGTFELAAQATWEAPRTALFGASGSGKTTLLEAIAGLRPVVAGEVVLDGRDLSATPARQRQIGWIPQDSALFPRMTVRENLAFAVRARGDEAAAASAIEFLEIGELLDRHAADLSGGERQRVAIARALASRPRFLLLDEPLASIDRPLRARIVPYLARLPTEAGVPFLLVSHDPLEVVATCDHVLVIESGRIVASGSPHAVFASARTFGALHALGAENQFDVRVVARNEGALELATRGGCRLVMAEVAGFPAPARVAVRAEDLLIATQRPEGLSAQNVLAATLVAIREVGLQTEVEFLADGEPWRAKVTRRAVQQLGLVPGKPAWLVIKAHAIQPCD